MDQQPDLPGRIARGHQVGQVERAAGRGRFQQAGEQRGGLPDFAWQADQLQLSSPPPIAIHQDQIALGSGGLQPCRGFRRMHPLGGGQIQQAFAAAVKAAPDRLIAQIALGVVATREPVEGIAAGGQAGSLDLLADLQIRAEACEDSIAAQQRQAGETADRGAASIGKLHLGTLLECAERLAEARLE